MELSFLMIRRTKFPWRRCHSSSPEGSVRTHSFLCLFWRAACAPAYVEAIPPGQRCDLMSHLRVCTCAQPCVHSALGPPWPVVLLFLDNGCIYTLILDYTADLQEGFYKGLAQADSRLNTPERRAKDCRPSAFVLSGATNARDTSKLTGTGTYHSQYLCLQCVL